MEVVVEQNSQKKKLELFVVQGHGPSLLGRSWLENLKLDWAQLNMVHAETKPKLAEVLNRHQEVFNEQLGVMKGVKVKIVVDEKESPQFFRPRTVPLAWKAKVEKELDRLVSTGVIEPVKFSDWAAPIVPVIKPDGSVRICGDYKLTVNKVAKLEAYPLPHVDDLFALLAGEVAFSKLDLANAYQQLELDDDSKKFVTVNTHKGLFQYNRLPFGVSSAPAIFQRTMDSLLQGIKHVCTYIDDILVTGENESEHLKNLDEVLKRLKEAGVTLKDLNVIFCSLRLNIWATKYQKRG
jgi:hypothetical protein